MPRSGVEAKIPWRKVPGEVKNAVAERLGARVIRGARVWGGYGPAPTFRLTLVDGRRAFLKGINPESNEFSRDAFTLEERIYENLGDRIRPWAPAYYGSIHRAGW